LIAAGQSIGNYRILNKIGTGGMGAVYLAEHPLIGKRVALKVIHRELAGNREVVSRFFQEARAVNKIGNEHIVQIHDFGVSPEGDHFYIMEYLEGHTLASVLSREPILDVMRSLHIGAQIANALVAAHAAGIVHRDVKPDNIMLLARLGDQDFVKVLDFGLAKVFSAATAVKTAAGVLLGTPQYMSPEACEGKRDIDHRTDVYALGVLLFQMMTGVLPFDGDSMGEVLVKQVTTLPPAPRALNPAIPPSVEQILLRCLAKPVDARFATMLLLREALLDPEAYLRGSPPIAPARASIALVLGEIQTMQVPAAPGAPAIPAALQKTRFATGAHGVAAHALPTVPAALQKTKIATANPLPLPAPVLSMSGAAAARTVIADQAPMRRASAAMSTLAQPHEPQMNTMRIATPMGYSSRPQRRIWPVVLMMAVLLGVGGGVISVTCFGREGGARASDTEVRSPAGSEPHGSTVASASRGAGDLRTATSNAAAGGISPATTRTSADAGAVAPAGQAPTPTGAESAGSSDASGGAGTPTGTETTAATTSSAVPASTTDPAGGPGAPAGVGQGRAGNRAGSSARPAPLRTAHLTIESVPAGAQVKGPDGEALGRTPLITEWPTSDVPVKFELRLGGYRPRHKQTVINGNTRLVIELERVSAVRRGGSRPNSGSAKTGSAKTGTAKTGSAKTGNGSAKTGNGDGLMRPDD
jgi:tRNA A-37 threonylcarbamoyl transferase component Bud32